MIREIRAKRLLSHRKEPDPWFGLKYNMNIYRGCQHQCIYCDSRSACYGIDDFADVLVKVNAIELLQQELASKRVKGTVGTGAMSDPYGPVERTYGLTGQALRVLAQHRFPVHLLTKSDLVLKDLQTFEQLSEVYAAVSFTVTTADDELAAKLEPGAPRPSARYRAMATLAAHGVLTGVMMMPILPFIEDNAENLHAIIARARDSGATYIVTGLGVTLRDRQRAYYYARLDELFPGLSARYERAFGERYHAAATNQRELERLVEHLCGEYGLATRMPQYAPGPEAEQLSLL
jgi:DNA repair photolyase